MQHLMTTISDLQTRSLTTTTETTTATTTATVTATATAATTVTATETAAATVTATATTHADAAMDIKDETTDTKDATMDTKDVDAVVDAAKDVNAQEQQHNRESIAGPTATAHKIALNATTRIKVTSTAPPMATGKAAATTSATVPVADGGGQ